MNTSSWALPAAALTLILGPAGCSSGGPYPVSGQVVYDDGKPATELAGWDVVFTSAEMRLSSSAMIGPDGRYALNYLKQGDGAMPGAYKVTITLADGFMPGGDDEEPDPAKPGPPPKPKPKPKRKPPLSAKYSKTDQTPLTATVEAKTNDVTLTVSRP